MTVFKVWASCVCDRHLTLGSVVSSPSVQVFSHFHFADEKYLYAFLLQFQLDNDLTLNALCKVAYWES